ncbi:hypothetical protein EGYY_11680 [Eggerthella sp. YY7918]|nr:hypothetical protein EGYY_11680 [Eggerthella sp. YY7918]
MEKDAMILSDRPGDTSARSETAPGTFFYQSFLPKKEPISTQPLTFQAAARGTKAHRWVGLLGG